MSSSLNSAMKRIFEVIGEKRTVFVIPHTNPDGDAVGSSIALCSILKNLGKDVYLYSRDEFPFNFKFLDGAGEVNHEIPAEEPDIYIILDAGHPKRVGDEFYAKFIKSSSVKIFFDHHVQYDERTEFDFNESSLTTCDHIHFAENFRKKFNLIKRNILPDISCDHPRIHKLY